ncbi:MAG TPA: non-homologous end-joining DNA ligase [Puia sp.]|nr:non-homologous end-joining DNA ligase [Puia sp.]
MPRTVHKPPKTIDLSGSPRSRIPSKLSPMLATLVDRPPDEGGWIYEVKWDGYRALAYCDRSKVQLLSRNNKSFNDKFYPIHEALSALNIRAVLDGEITALEPSGAASFSRLQAWRSEADGELFYYVFDVLWLNGHDLTNWPLTRRRGLLKSILPPIGLIRESHSFETSADEFLAAAKKMNLEGMIAKRGDSVYRPGDRSRDWVKIKIKRRQEVVIGGFTKNDDSPKLFSALLIGLYDNGELHYIGKVGTGFNDRLQRELMAKFKPLIVQRSPFTITPDVNEPSRFRPHPPHAEAFWLKPRLVCEVNFAEMTPDGSMRHPSFEALREDKDPKDVHAEVPRLVTTVEGPAKAAKKGSAKKQTAGKRNTKPAAAKPTAARPAKSAAPKPAARKPAAAKPAAPKPAAARPAKPAAPKPASSTSAKAARTGKPASFLQPAEPGGRRTLLNPTDQRQVRMVCGHELTFNNLSKIFWRREGYTKRDLINYYYQAAPFIMPYLLRRPQSLNRFPNGIEGKSFYQKDVTATAPAWIEKFPYHTSTGEDKNFLVPLDEASLLWMANLGAIEMNPWNSTIDSPDHPDWCIIDLDPTDSNPFAQVIRTALVTREVIDELGVPGYPKTSGSTGIHIYIPMGAKYTYEECQAFGKLIATRVHQRLPRITSIERLTERRKGLIYVDYLQNRPKATLAAPYSVRPKPGATVSMPLHWEEVKKGLGISQFTLRNAIARMRAEGDLFKPVLGKAIDLEKVLSRTETVPRARRTRLPADG